MRHKADTSTVARSCMVVVVVTVLCLAASCQLMRRQGAQAPHEEVTVGQSTDLRSRGDGSQRNTSDEDALDTGSRALEELGLEGTLGAREWTTPAMKQGDIEHVARDILTSYRDEGDCVLAQSGYLDLFGTVWSCVVYGGSWADVCVVDEMEDGKHCQLRVLHLSSSELAELWEEDDA